MTQNSIKFFLKGTLIKTDSMNEVDKKVKEMRKKLDPEFMKISYSAGAVYHSANYIMDYLTDHYIETIRKKLEIKVSDEEEKLI